MTHAPKYQCGMGDPLDMVVEECAEVIKEAMKLRRFGPDGTPLWRAIGNASPRELLIAEIGDLLAVVDVARVTGALGDPEDMTAEIEEARQRKFARLFDLFGYMHPAEGTES